MSVCRVFIAAAVLHVLVSTTIFLLGHFRITPNLFNEDGISHSFAVDSLFYQQLSLDLTQTLQTDGLWKWASLRAPIQCQLYSLVFASAGKLFGYNILVIEPVNLLFYLVVLWALYLIGRELFDQNSALIATVLVAVWPSFVFHTTQLLRDTVSIAFMLFITWILTITLRRVVTWVQVSWLAVLAILLLTLFWVTRGNMWNIVLSAVFLTILFFVGRTVWTRRLLAPNMVLLVLIFLTALVMPAHIGSISLAGAGPPTAIIAISSDAYSKQGPLRKLINRIRTRRQGFLNYNIAESNIDSDVKLDGGADILRYLPRAAEIGFFAPFPYMWIEKGHTGYKGRILAGIETLAMYFLYIMAILALWHERKNPGAWLLTLVATLGMIGLGLVVMNVAALYRLRYGCWMLVLVLAGRGIKSLANRRGDLSELFVSPDR